MPTFINDDSHCGHWRTIENTVLLFVTFVFAVCSCFPVVHGWKLEWWESANWHMLGHCVASHTPRLQCIDCSLIFMSFISVCIIQFISTVLKVYYLKVQFHFLFTNQRSASRSSQSIIFLAVSPKYWQPHHISAINNCKNVGQLKGFCEKTYCWKSFVQSRPAALLVVNSSFVR